MSHRDNVLNCLNRRKPERQPHGDGLWGETYRRYVDEGYMEDGEDATEHFDMSWRSGGWFNSVARVGFEPEVIEETDEWALRLDGNGAKLKYWKGKAGTPEHVDFEIKERGPWDEKIKPLLMETNRDRIRFEGYRDAKARAAEEGRCFFWSGVAPFEQVHPLCGHEHMLMGMALDPDWVQDMFETYADMTLRHMEILFEEEGAPDAFWFYEDMGFKGKPFMSAAMYEKLLQPSHARLFEYAHSLGCKVLVHSCGFVEAFVPGLIDAGMDCLQAMEVKAGMDLRTLAPQFGDRIAFCGNLDIRIVAGNDRKAIDEELKRKILPVFEAGSEFIVHSDHSIPPEVDHDTLKYFFERGATIRDWA